MLTNYFEISFYQPTIDESGAILPRWALLQVVPSRMRSRHFCQKLLIEKDSSADRSNVFLSSRRRFVSQPRFKRLMHNMTYWAHHMIFTWSQILTLTIPMWPCLWSESSRRDKHHGFWIYCWLSSSKSALDEDFLSKLAIVMFYDLWSSSYWQ